ncbi:MAG: beta-galactosidase [Bryobacteraceae bacterium]|nr:beta-galactosidase [Bryobacteraceae bacterium]
MRRKLFTPRPSGAAERATNGKYALRVIAEPAREAQVEIPVRGPSSDWTPHGSIAVDVVNASRQQTSLTIEVEDSSGATSAGRTVVPVRPAESVSLALPLNPPGPLDMGMRGEPPIPGFQLLVADHKPVTLKRMALVRVRIPANAAPTTLFIDNLRAGPSVSYDRIVDRFGQFSKAQWPGKLAGEADLAARWREERAELQARPSLPGRDQYGGWAAGPKLKATGFFRAEKRNGKWWLATPDGHLFFSLGLNSINYVEGNTVVKGREGMFEWLPKDGDPLASHRAPPEGHAPLGLKIKLFSGRGFNFYTANLERKYGKDWIAEWRKITLARLRAWGFNTIANWSDPSLYDLKQAPYTATLDIGGNHARLSSGSDYWTRMHDSFDPVFAKSVDSTVRDLATRRRNDPWCIGYFVDNELPWGGMRDPRTRYGLALGALSLGPESPAKRALVAQLKSRYGAIEKLNQSWTARFASWEALEKPAKWDADLNAAMQRDLGLFVKELAERYFRTIRDALKKYDPNHMYLGTRFAWYTSEEVHAAAEFCDVVSFNIYRAVVDPAQYAILDEIDRPVVIGEFHMGALDRGMFHTGLVASRDQDERARMYQAYVRSVAAHPKLVGSHFFKYVDEPVVGRPGDGENYNIGFVTITDSLYPEMIAAAKQLHAAIYDERDRGLPPQVSSAR